jgi:photosystem II stability/assembly factor-like uncharacterized protein
VTVTADGQILLASREGGLRSSDVGATWERMVNGLPGTNISSISYDDENKRLLATSFGTSVVFESRDSGHTWTSGPDSGYPLRRVTFVGGHFVGATLFDGVIVQPQN